MKQSCCPDVDENLPLIVAIDLQPMAPIEGVIQVQGDITNARTAEVVIRHFDGCKADLVVCDGAPDEAFAVCENYSPPEGFNPKDLHRLLEKVGSPSGVDDTDCCSGWLEGPNKVYIPFLGCGDLSGYDSDRSYPLPKVAGGTYQSLDPVQPPIAPPYKRALELKKASSQGFRELEKLSLDS
ncbi:hypothetical protein JHK85_037904 [Glycine max]|nr:hypothetical protein JHK85_037904 [Glycine max]